MEMAKILAQESKCVSLKVGAILTIENRIISTGINGTPTNMTNCSDIFTHRSKEHSDWSNVHEIHAEMNCLLFAARHGISTDNTTLYCTTEPCIQCLKNLVQAGIKSVYYDTVYYNEDDITRQEKFSFLENLENFHFIKI